MLAENTLVTIRLPDIDYPYVDTLHNILQCLNGKLRYLTFKFKSRLGVAIMTQFHGHFR